jgi:hypothetical protein
MVYLYYEILPICMTACLRYDNGDSNVNKSRQGAILDSQSKTRARWRKNW